MKHLRHPSAQIPILTSVLAAGTVMAAVTIIMAGNVLYQPPVKIPSIMLQTADTTNNISDTTPDIIPDCRVQDKTNLKLTLTEADNSGAFNVVKGDLVAINLEENATTGYAWHFIYNTRDFRLICRENSTASSNSEPVIGAGKMVNFYFRALQASDVTAIAGNYERSFEKNSTIKAVTFKFLVAEK